MAGIPGKGGVKGRNGPPGNQNAFKHGLAAIQKRREESITTEYEDSIRQQILEGLIADKGGDDQVSTTTRILAEVIASDAAWLMVFNGAIDHIIQNNPKARQNPRGLGQLDGYKRGLVNSLTGNLQKFELDRVAKVESLEEIFSEADETSENPSPLAVAGLCVTIGHYWYLFKRLTAVFGARFYRFEHIVSYSSGKVIAK